MLLSIQCTSKCKEVIYFYQRSVSKLYVYPRTIKKCLKGTLSLKGLGTKKMIWAAAWQNQQNELCTQQSLSSVFAWINIVSLATHWAHSDYSDQTGRMPKLIWVFAARTGHFVSFVVLILYLGGSFHRGELAPHPSYSLFSPDGSSLTPSGHRSETKNKTFEPPHDKTNTMAYASSDDSDAQADLSLRWVHMPFCWFCHEAAHLKWSMTKAYRMTCAPSEDMDPVWSVFTICIMGSYGPKLSSGGQWRLIRLAAWPGWSESLLDAQFKMLILLCFSSCVQFSRFPCWQLYEPWHEKTLLCGVSNQTALLHRLAKALKFRL